MQAVQNVQANVTAITPLFIVGWRFFGLRVFVSMDTQGFNNSFEALLDSEQAGALLHVHEKTVIRWARQRKLPSMRLGKLWRFRASQLDEWLASQAQSSCQPT